MRVGSFEVLERMRWYRVRVLAGDHVCRNCGNAIVRHPDSPTGWTHGDVEGRSVGLWVGKRCPRRLTGAVPADIPAATWRQRLDRLVRQVRRLTGGRP